MTMEIRSNKLILLTGAGFTHNFGAPLADQLWGMIFNHRKIQASQRVRNIFLGNPDFEAVYHEIMEGSYDPQEKEATKEAITKTYYYIDKIVMNFSFNRDSPYPVNIYKVQAMINAFSGTSREPGFLFTLNQDLFLERKYYNGERPLLPGIRHRIEWFTPNQGPLTREQYISLPSEAEVINLSKDFKMGSRLFYLKLHGSCNWMSSIHGNQMVIGRKKTEKINEEPLLKWYFNIFNKVLFQSSCKLLLIGYGFRDEHINEILSNAVNEYELRIYIISPLSPVDFRNRLFERNYGEQIWNGVGGYYCYTLAQLFPSDQSESMGWEIIQEQFFERKIIS